MTREILKIVGTGEIWINGKMIARIYPNGDLISNRKRIGKILEDGDVVIDSRSVGRVFANGDVWIGNKKVATGVYLVNLMDDSTPPPRPNNTKRITLEKDEVPPDIPQKPQTLDNPPPTSEAVESIGCVGILFITSLIVICIYACFRMWISEIPTLLSNNLQNVGGIATFLTYACMFIAAYSHCALVSHRRRIMFFGALLTQSALFFANLVVFTFIELVTYAIPYGFSIFDALGELRGALGGSLFENIFTALTMGLAPTIVTSLLGYLFIRSKITLPLPAFLNRPR